MHEFHLFLAAVGIGVPLSVRWELPPVLAGFMCLGLRSLLILLEH